MNLLSFSFLNFVGPVESWLSPHRLLAPAWLAALRQNSRPAKT